MEVWKSVLGYEGLYEVSNLGRVKGLKKIRVIAYGGIRTYPETIFKNCTNSHGYSVVILRDYGKNKTFMVHRLVADHFLDNPANYKQVNHKNGVKNDNRVSNLEWCDSYYNMAHAKETGLLNNDGELNFKAVLTEKEVHEIRLSEKSLLELSKKYNVTKVSISNVKRRKTWRHI